MERKETPKDVREEILELLAGCINCRFCLPSCPRFDITNGDTCQGASGITRSLYYAVKWKETDRKTLHELRDILYACTTCKNCELACKRLSTATKLVEAIEKGRQLLIDETIGPMPAQRKALQSLFNYGNPYGELPSKRTEWLKTLSVPNFSEGVEILLYIGCTAFQDPDARNMAMSLVRLLKKAKVRFAILEDEICCGEPAFRLGEIGLFEDICTKNLSRFESIGVKRIVTLSPHCFDTFGNRYPEGTMQDIQIQHYTQLLADLIEQKRLRFKKTGEKRRKVVFQDPCYLGKHNDVYDAPRKVLQSIPGLEIMEFPRARVDSLCCGGGGGRMWSDFESERSRLANIRIQEALGTGADIIATACPWCFINMVDGIKAVQEKESSELQSKDLAQLCAEAL